MTRRTRHRAQNTIVDAIVAAALAVSEEDDEELAGAIRVLGATIAKRFGLTQCPGLPDTFKGG